MTEYEHPHRSSLRRIAARRDRQAEALRETRAELAAELRAAVNSGVPPTEAARLAGISRKHVYTLIERKGK